MRRHQNLHLLIGADSQFLGPFLKNTIQVLNILYAMVWINQQRIHLNILLSFLRKETIHSALARIHASGISVHV